MQRLMQKNFARILTSKKVRSLCFSGSSRATIYKFGKQMTWVLLLKALLMAHRLRIQWTEMYRRFFLLAKKVPLSWDSNIGLFSRIKAFWLTLWKYKIWPISLKFTFTKKWSCHTPKAIFQLQKDKMMIPQKMPKRAKVIFESGHKDIS